MELLPLPHSQGSAGGICRPLSLHCHPAIALLTCPSPPPATPSLPLLASAWLHRGADALSRALLSPGSLFPTGSRSTPANEPINNTVPKLTFASLFRPCLPVYTTHPERGVFPQKLCPSWHSLLHPFTCSLTSPKPPYRNSPCAPTLLGFSAFTLLSEVPELPNALLLDPREWKPCGLLWVSPFRDWCHTHCDPPLWLSPLPLWHCFRAPAAHMLRFLWEACRLSPHVQSPYCTPSSAPTFVGHSPAISHGKRRCLLLSFPSSLQMVSLWEECVGGKISCKPSFLQESPFFPGSLCLLPFSLQLAQFPSLVTTKPAGLEEK